MCFVGTAVGVVEVFLRLKARRMTEDIEIDEARRKEIFLKLVELEDGGSSPSDAARQIMTKFGISKSELNAIADEGAEAGWPPLEPCDDDEE
jgi:hypothetical protein